MSECLHGSGWVADESGASVRHNTASLVDDEDIKGLICDAGNAVKLHHQARCNELAGWRILVQDKSLGAIQDSSVRHLLLNKCKHV